MDHTQFVFTACVYHSLPMFFFCLIDKVKENSERCRPLKGCQFRAYEVSAQVIKTEDLSCSLLR